MTKRKYRITDHFYTHHHHISQKETGFVEQYSFHIVGYSNYYTSHYKYDILRYDHKEECLHQHLDTER